MSPVFQPPPSLPLDRVRRLVLDHYELEGNWTPLPGERDLNFRLDTGDGRTFVVKVANPEDSAELLGLQNAAMTRLADAWRSSRAPRPIPSRDGGALCTLDSADGNPVRVRVLTFLPGTPLSGVEGRDPHSLRRLGTAVGEMDALLADLEWPNLERDLPWDLARAGWISAHTRRIPDREGRALVERWILQYRGRVVPHLGSLPRSLIHGDANDENVLVVRDPEGGWRVAGLVDFGDMVHSHTVNDLAIACAYVLFGVADPLAAAGSVVAGYHRARPLSEPEIRVLFPLVGMRLCVSVMMSALAATEDPENPHRQISAGAAWETLERLATVDWRKAEEGFREVCGLAPRQSGPVGPREATLDSLVERRRRRIGPSLILSYESPRTILRGRGQFLFDPEGRAYLDCVNNIGHVGHCHPRVVAALADQAAVLNTNTRYLHPYMVEYAERLAATFPDPLQVCYFVNSGSEANELVVRLARAHTGRQDVVVVEGAYHGNTTTLVDLSPYKCEGPGGSGLPSWAHKVTTPDSYRGPHRGWGESVGRAYAEEMRSTCDRLLSEDRPPALFLCESILGCGGQVVLPEGYLREAFAHVRVSGGLCAVDEVQVGMGRVGSHWWAFERQGVVPDIVALGKPLGNGHPLGAVITTPEIAASFANGIEYFNSFGGNPVSMAVGLAVLDVIDEEGLRDRAARVGRYLKDGFEVLAGRHPQIGDIRGAGMFLGIELVRDRETREPATEETGSLVERVLEDGILLSAEGPYHNILKIKPPLAFQETDADLLLGALDRALEALPPRS